MSLLSGPDLDVEYPATVGVAESGLHALVRFLTYGALRNYFAGRRDCFVGQDRNIYYRYGDSKTFVAPDVFVCFGVDPGPLELDRSYRPWDAGGPPLWVLEIASENTYRADLEEKPAVFLEMGVGEYWRFDPTGGEFYVPVLQGDRRAGEGWEPIEVTLDGDDRLRGHSAVLDLDVHAETQRLRFRDPHNGQWIPDPDEICQQRDDAAARRAAEARSRTDAAARRAAEIRSSAAEAARRAAESQRDAAEAELAALRARFNEQPN